MKNECPTADNDDFGRPCGLDEDGEPCPACEAWLEGEQRYWRAQWAVASPAERDPARYEREILEAGR